MDKKELQLLAQKYLAGNATPQEKQLLDEWYDTVHSGFPETVNLQTPETEADVKQRMFNNLNMQLFTEGQSVNRNHPATLIKRLTIWAGSVAAVLVLAFLPGHGMAIILQLIPYKQINNW
jgi:transmembrane sensor